jgi:hypothetical protein
VAVLAIAAAGCSPGGEAPPASGSFSLRAVLVSATLSEAPASWPSCAADPVLHDGDEVVVADPGAPDGGSLGMARLGGGERAPLRETFADDQGYSMQPEEARACTWRVTIENVAGGRGDYELRVNGTDTAQSKPMPFVARIPEADARGGVRVALEYIGGPSAVVMPGLKPR